MQITTVTNKDGYIRTRSLDYGEFGLLMAEMLSDPKMEMTSQTSGKRETLLETFSETSLTFSSEDGYFIDIYLVERIKGGFDE